MTERKHRHKIIILIIILVLMFAACAINLFSGTQNQEDVLFNDIQSQVHDIKLDFESVYKELENYKNEMSTINYNDDISDIYNKILELQDKINDLYEIIEQYKAAADITTETTETTEIKEECSFVDDEKSNNRNDGIYIDMYDKYYGRLYIPDLNINVALYCGNQQYITDRADSANIFSFDGDVELTIADHNNQAFSRLHRVKVGIKGYIEHRQYGRINIECVEVFNGYNNGRYIVDESGINAMNRTAYMMYTCKNDTDGVLICLWKVV